MQRICLSASREPACRLNRDSSNPRRIRYRRWACACDVCWESPRNGYDTTGCKYAAVLGDLNPWRIIDLRPLMGKPREVLSRWRTRYVEEQANVSLPKTVPPYTPKYIWGIAGNSIVQKMAALAVDEYVSRYCRMKALLISGEVELEPGLPVRPRRPVRRARARVAAQDVRRRGLSGAPAGDVRH